MSLDATVGTTTSNSYASLAEADTYFTDHWSVAKNSAWAALTDPQKSRLLIAATQILESLRVLDAEYAPSGPLPPSYGPGPVPPALRDISAYDFTIHKLNFDQRLQFPRNIDVPASLAAFIPQEVKDAQCEQAVYLVSFDDSQIATQVQGIDRESVSAGSVHVTTSYARRGSFVSPMTLQLMLPFIRKGNRMRRG